MNEMKGCMKCGEMKEIKEFNVRKYGKNGIGFHFCCKLCQAAISHKSYVKNRKKHNARSKAWREKHPQKTKAMFKKSQEKNRFKAVIARSIIDAKERNYTPCMSTEIMLREAFTGKCHVCGKPESEHHTRLCMDHCHETGKFRGWLCSQCNTSIGHAKESIERLLELALYLEQAKKIT